ncbi:helix-turn-helix domain-containing protein [Psychrobacter pygoscelis]|uniref:helix-turn-helix domain-containing protein n=1 Tax=Psychrobacter pygoscelis TaxID=2488563 RepID=UPI00103F3CD9|nr:helix-turn-helix transcriptional regulator [Psychrobacter pygoscelis]
MENEILHAFGTRIRKLRKLRNLSQEQLAELTGFHRTYISMIERGERNPALVNIKIFADKFEISLSQLFDENLFETEVKSGKEEK